MFIAMLIVHTYELKDVHNSIIVIVYSGSCVLVIAFYLAYRQQI